MFKCIRMFHMNNNQSGNAMQQAYIVIHFLE